MSESVNNTPSQSLLRKPIVWAVGFPMLALLVYYLFIVSDRYECESVFFVRAQEGAALPNSEGLAGMLVGNLSSNRDDALLLEQYITSRDMLRILDDKFQLKEAFQDRAIDRFSRLGSEPTEDELLDFYRRLVYVRIGEGSIMTLRLQGFVPELTQAVTAYILEESERYVNEISQNLADDQVAFIRQQVNRAEEDLREARQAIQRFENENQSPNPTAESQSSFQNITSLQSQLALARAELTQLRAYLTEEAPQVFTLRSRIAGLEEQIELEKARLTDDQRGISQMVYLYQNLVLEREFAMQAYTSAYSSLEAAQLEASRKLKNLVVVETPAIPTEAEYPRRGFILGTAFIILLLIYALGRLVAAVIEEHRI